MSKLIKQKLSLAYPFILMFSIVFFLSFNLSVLHGVRNTIAVVDLGGGAQTIPYLELFGALPGAILMTLGLTQLLKRFTLLKVFVLMMAIFVGFFLLFALCIYPALKTWGETGRSPELYLIVAQICSTLFYVTAELWKPALALILFWGLVNQNTPFDKAKRLYAPLMLGSSLGTITAGPAISLATSLSSEWRGALVLMIFGIFVVSLITTFLYYKLWIHFSKNRTAGVTDEETVQTAQAFSLKGSLALCWKSPKLRLLSWLVVADYIAYSLGEVIFLDILKLRFPEPCDYCNYMGRLSMWSGLLTVLSALFITPLVLKHCRWVIAALVTPICLLVTEGAFFIILRAQGLSFRLFGWTEAEWLLSAIVLGSLQYCLCCMAKYTLFDSSKELAFVTMSSQEKMQGKLIVDGISARFGRGSASVLSISFIALSGGVLASSLVTGFVAIGLALSWLKSTLRLGKIIEDAPIESKKLVDTVHETL